MLRFVPIPNQESDLVMKEGRVSKIFADATGVTQEQILEAAMNM